MHALIRHYKEHLAYARIGVLVRQADVDVARNRLAQYLDEEKRRATVEHPLALSNKASLLVWAREGMLSRDDAGDWFMYFWYTCLNPPPGLRLFIERIHTTEGRRWKAEALIQINGFQYEISSPTCSTFAEAELLILEHTSQLRAALEDCHA